MAEFSHHPEYDVLPECLQAMITQKEFAWMTDHDRERVIEDFCYPDWETEAP